MEQKLIPIKISPDKLKLILKINEGFWNKLKIKKVTIGKGK